MVILNVQSVCLRNPFSIGLGSYGKSDRFYQNFILKFEVDGSTNWKTLSYER